MPGKNHIIGRTLDDTQHVIPDAAMRTEERCLGFRVQPLRETGKKLWGDDSAGRHYHRALVVSYRKKALQRNDVLKVLPSICFAMPRTLSNELHFFQLFYASLRLVLPQFDV